MLRTQGAETIKAGGCPPNSTLAARVGPRACLAALALIALLAAGPAPATAQDHLAQFNTSLTILTVEVRATLDPLNRKFLEKLKKIKQLNDKARALYKKADKLRERAPDKALILRIARETQPFCREIELQDRIQQRGPAATDLVHVRRMVLQYRQKMDRCLEDVKEDVRHCKTEKQARSASIDYRRCKSEMDKIIDLEQSLSFMATQVTAGLKVRKDSFECGNQASQLEQAIEQLHKNAAPVIKDAEALVLKWKDAHGEISKRAAAVYGSIRRNYPDGLPAPYDEKWRKFMRLLDKGHANEAILSSMKQGLDSFYRENTGICYELRQNMRSAHLELAFLENCTKSQAWSRLQALLQFLVEQKAEAGIVFLAARDTIQKGIQKCRSAGQRRTHDQPAPPDRPAPSPEPSPGPSPGPQTAGVPQGLHGTWEIRPGLRVRFLSKDGALAAYVVEVSSQHSSKYPQGLMVIKDINPVGPNRYGAKVLVWGGTAKNWIPVVLAPQGDEMAVHIGKNQGRYRRVGP